MTRKLFLSLLFCLCLLAFSATGWAAEKTYQITETELTRLEKISNRQQGIIVRLSDTLQTLKLNESEAKVQLAEALTDLRTMKSELASLQTELTNSATSLERANQYFEEYAKEMKSRLRAAKWQKNLWAAGFVGVLILALGT